MLQLITAYIRIFQYNLHGAFMRRRIGKLSAKFSGTILDIGAGDQPYRELFSCERYLATNTKRHYAGKEDAMAAYTDIWIDDASSLPLENESVDHVVCFQVMSVVQEPEKFFREVYRVLKPGGYFLLTTDFLYPSWSREDKARYSAIELSRMAALAGLTTEEIQGFGGLRSLQYMLRSRWVRGYYSRIQQARGLKKTARILQWIIDLSLLPAGRIYGWYTFRVERDVKDNTEETFNLLCFTRKPLVKQA